ncbi:cell wall hydrolase [Natronohydrobacter thiooxidans]|uniref:cell wall hydrolase n=1 Tax=Natronohydrobacter thiooxidans TaxID=87172 RepID=UPI000ACB3187|nr:cell wall hydrolase [Natronohydrobacter thiooxidans]
MIVRIQELAAATPARVKRFATRQTRALGRVRPGALARRKSLTFSTICTMAALVALPSVGSRLEDATLHSEARARLVMASLQDTNPAHRNRLMVDLPATEDARLAALTPESPVPTATAFGVILQSPQAAAPIAPPVPLTLDSTAEAMPENPLRYSLHPMARPSEATVQDAAGTETRLSTQGALAAPVALTPPTHAPLASLRPAARPASMNRRTVQYSRNWLRSVPLRDLTEQEACLATAIYHEARGESIRGQFAVAEVIVNRAASRNFPNSICGVVYQGARGQRGGCQFSFACDGRPETMPNRNAANKARRIAMLMSEGAFSRLTEGALYFHTTAVRPGWSQRFTQTSQIGAHLFYRG